MFVNFNILRKICETREKALDFCVLNGLIPRVRTCQAGKHQVEWQRKSTDEGTALNRYFECNRHSNSNLKGESAATETWFERHNIPIEDVLFITYSFCENLSYDQLQKQLMDGDVAPDGTIVEINRKMLSNETISDIYSYCREVVMLGLDRLYEDEGLLGGEGVEVQIDEMKIGHWKYYKGRYVDGVWVFGAVEVSTKRLRLEIIPDNCRSKENMRQFIQKYVAPGSRIISNAASFYHNINEWGYEHRSANHSETFANEDGYRTNQIKSNCEDVWRRHCKRNNIDPFMMLLEMIRQVYPGKR